VINTESEALLAAQKLEFDNKIERLNKIKSNRDLDLKSTNISVSKEDTMDSNNRIESDTDVIQQNR
jgi:hypothetical protein